MKFTRGCPRGCDFWSLPSRERGLKYYVRERNVRHRVVAPLAGAWIEMISLLQPESVIYVAPLAGAWIEIVGVGVEVSDTAVAPLAGAWIEIGNLWKWIAKKIVAPLAGAWIEIPIT